MTISSLSKISPSILIFDTIKKKKHIYKKYKDINVQTIPIKIFFIIKQIYKK